MPRGCGTGGSDGHRIRVGVSGGSPERDVLAEEAMNNAHYQKIGKLYASQVVQDEVRRSSSGTAHHVELPAPVELRNVSKEFPESARRRRSQPRRRGGNRLRRRRAQRGRQVHPVRLVNGLEEPTSGSVPLDGHDLSPLGGCSC
ncbi:hypothetical protein ACTVZO_01505 [Streptomyces sp. IBSNAI002]|uniref:hypothetical protein n=1 Tax=Streptomyces sp. IBSNAI002 TaxID=3457500 RepID=UPI003FD23317